MKQNIIVKGVTINFFSQKKEEYISLTDIARYKNSKEPKDIVKNWLRNKTTIEFLGVWESIYNSKFKGVEFDTFRNEAGGNSFVLSPQKWIEKTNAIGIISKSGNKGGTFAHQDIAFEFASWISVEFRLYLIKEFQRLKLEENKKQSIEWDLKRNLAKINYEIQKDAIKRNLIPSKISLSEEQKIYSNEADLLNKALFGTTAKEWKISNPNKQGNLRDYANVTQLVVLSNLESLNSEFIKEGVAQFERLIRLNQIAIE